MQLRYNYRLYPAPGQHAALARAFGCARVVFNDGLRARQQASAAGRPYLTDAELSKRLTAAKATSTAIIRDSQAVYAEDLCVAGLARTRLAKSVHDAGWSAFVTMLEYKARRYGRVFGKVPRSYPSSQVCSACGRRDGPKPLHVRSWTCPGCGTLHDRDINAAVNVLTEGCRIVAAGRKPRAGMPGEAETLNACGDGVRPPLAVAAVRETGSRPKPRPDAA